MENSLYLGLSRQMVLRSDMGIIANNVANMNTAGYRGQNTLFKEYISDPRGQEDPLSFVYDYGQYEVTTPGPLQQTENNFDVALVGPGFISVEAPGGGQAYTRAGNFQMRPDGTLVTSAGHVVSGEGGAIVIPEGATALKIDYNGTISTQDGEIGKLSIIEFPNIQELEPLGDNLYTTTAQGQAATETTVRQGFLEGSNVNGVTEMSRMIDTLRSYQSIQKLMDSENERLRTAIRKLTSSN